MNDKPRLFGADYSVYVRTARLALLEKDVDHDLVPVDIFSGDGVPDWYLEHHPFKRIPAFEHGSLRLFETSAITRYVDEAFDGPSLQPSSPKDRAVMNQIIGIVDQYAYRAMVWGVYVERISNPRDGRAANDALIAESLATARTCLDVLSGLIDRREWLASNALSLADLHVAPVMAYFAMAPEGEALLGEYSNLSLWWERVARRPAIRQTLFKK